MKSVIKLDVDSHLRLYLRLKFPKNVVRKVLACQPNQVSEVGLVGMECYRGVGQVCD